MYIIDNKIVSAELFSRKFICNLSKCKGACCWEGDFGAPVTDEEDRTIKANLSTVQSLLSDASNTIIEVQGHTTYNSQIGGKVTPLHPDGACVYLVKGDDGVSNCAFEMAYNEGLSTFRKPISCHLYPIRITENAETKFEALNYDEWDICSAACQLGEEQRMPVFRFLKEAIIRKYGTEFYDQMEDIYQTYFA